MWASLVAQEVKNLLAMQPALVQSLGREDPLERGKPTHSSILACRIPQTEEPVPATVPAFGKSRTQLSTCVSLSVKCLFKSFAHFFPIGSFVFLIEVLHMLE